MHSFQNFSNTQAQILVMATPGGFHHFFEKLSSLQSQDPARLEQLAREYGSKSLARRCPEQFDWGIVPRFAARSDVKFSIPK